MERAGAMIDFGRSKISLALIKRPVCIALHNLGKRLSIFLEGKAGCSPQLSQWEACRIEEQVSAGHLPEINTRQSNFWLDRSRENITIAPKYRQILLGRLEAEKEQTLPLPI